MKAYLIVTGILFGLMSVVHVLRVIAEWSYPPRIGFILSMALIIVLPGILSWWAWRLLRNLPSGRAQR